MSKIGKKANRPSRERYKGENRRTVNKRRRVLRSSHGKWTYEALLDHQRKVTSRRKAVRAALRAAGIETVEGIRRLVKQLDSISVEQITAQVRGKSGSQALGRLYELVGDPRPSTSKALRRAG